ncbi:MAG: response regulator [Syntrophus sp. (in: bacteria)]|nr:response regulator [Syntrophus sp. (in: bacteria)]
MKSKKQTILIVDDEPTNIEILSDSLGKTYEILIAVNGQEALEVALKAIPDLILLDIIMPEMGGYDVCQSLKENLLLKDIPVIFITALDNEIQETWGLKMGAVDYITKPFNTAIVKLRVKNQLQLKLQRDALALRNTELKEALAKIKTLSGLIPICASCKKIRDDKGYWNQLEVYIRDHSDAEFSHGYCPECIKKLYPQHYDNASREDETK